MMTTEVIKTGKTIEEAVEEAYKELGKTAADCEVTVLEEPKKGLFGLFKSEAKVKVTVKGASASAKPAQSKAPATDKPVEKMGDKVGHDEKLSTAVAYLKDVLSAMGIDGVEVKVEEKDENAILTLQGEKLGILIGRHGETLDALQYLTSLVCNRVEGGYYRITLDCGDYREKREQALKELASKISAKVKRIGRSQMLEPMNPYERRIIHAEISNVEGVTSKSKGEEPNRRVVIIPTDKRGYNDRGEQGDRNDRPRRSGDRRDRGGERRRQAPYKAEPTMEQLLKADRAEKSEEEKAPKRYSKIEL